MKRISTAIFLILSLCYGLLFATNIITVHGLSSGDLFEMRENSLLTYSLIAVFLLLLSICLVNFFGIGGGKHPAEFWIILALMLYSVGSGAFSILAYGDVRFVVKTLGYGNINVLTFMAYYFCGRKELLSRSFLTNYALVIFLVTGCLFLVSYSRDSGYYGEYIFGDFHSIFQTLPWLLSYGSKNLRVVFLFVMGILVAYGGKRSIFISYIGATVAYFFVKNVFVEKKFRLLYIFGFPVVLVAIFALLFLFADFSYIASRMNNIGYDQGSGRLALWNYAYSMYIGSPPLLRIFGHGPSGTLEALNLVNLMGLGSFHNEFLDILYNYGVVGLAMFVSLIVLSVMRLFRMLKADFEFAPAYAAWLSCFFVMACVSIFFSNCVSGELFFSFWGYMSGTFLSKKSGKFPPVPRGTMSRQ